MFYDMCPVCLAALDVGGRWNCCAAGRRGRRILVRRSLASLAVSRQAAPHRARYPGRHGRRVWQGCCGSWWRPRDSRCSGFGCGPPPHVLRALGALLLCSALAAPLELPVLLWLMWRESPLDEPRRRLRRRPRLLRRSRSLSPLESLCRLLRRRRSSPKARPVGAATASG